MKQKTATAAPALKTVDECVAQIGFQP